MANLPLWAAALACVLIITRWGRHLAAKREQDRQIALHGCQPAKTLTRNPWLFGLDIAWEMATSYDTGTRNMELAERFERHGPTFRTLVGGGARIFTIDPDNVKAVFGEKSDDWGVVPVRREAFRPLVAGGVLVSDGDEWRHARALAQSIIDRIFRRYSSDAGEFRDAVDALIARIPGDGTTVDLQPILYQYTMDSSTENIFGTRIGALQPGKEGEYGREFLEAFIYCLKMAGERDEVPQWTYMVLDAKFRRSCRIVHRFVDDNIHRALDLCSGGGDDAADTAGEKNSGNGKNAGTSEKTPDASDGWAQSRTDLNEARNQILNVMAASFDTIAILLTNTFFHLARNPACYAELRKEVEDFVAQGEALEASNIKSLRYLHAVLNESLRLNGPASFNSRVAMVDKVIPHGGGADGQAPVLVRRGDNVIVSAFALQRRPEVYGDDPHVFRPDRWLGDDHVKPRHWDFVPFSAGPRVCPGQKFALLHGAYALFALVRQFKRIENRDTTLEFIEEYRVATGSKNGAVVALWT